MHSSMRIVLLLIALATTDAALAQQTIVFSVEGWGKLSNRDDGKAIATSFQWGVTAPASPATGGAGKPSVQDAVLALPIGDAAVRFAQAAIRGLHLTWVLVEFPLTRGDQKGPAPFAVRLTEVFVTSVSLGKSGSDGGPGIAEVKLNASRIEIFSSKQDAKGGMSPASKTGWDVRAGRPL